MTARRPILDRRAFLAAGVGLTACQAKPSVMASTRDATNSHDLRMIQDRIDAAISEGRLPWAVLQVTQGSGDILVHAAGVEPSHLDVLRSATKIATVTAVMTLVRDGGLTLSDPVARFIPSFASDTGGEKAGVTIRHLLSMNSGLPARWQGFSDDMSLAAAADAIARAPLLAPPGEQFIYGNLGLTVAGRVAEIVSGRPWDQFFQDAVASPLGLTFNYVPLETGRLGGGGQTNADSYTKLLRVHLTNGVDEETAFLPKHLVDEMQLPNGSRFTNPIPEINLRGYGMGWWFDDVDTSGAPRVISDPGAWGSYPWIDRERRYGALLFTRRQLAQGAALQREIRPSIDRLVDGMTRRT
jgi:CubicO group peptidase (beta-lactamase class C family)